MAIRILPQHVANLIAAGEVVQRPASVVKELMENAVDAGARDIKVSVKDAGRTLIQVIDDGCGMGADEAALAFERHATSKLATAEDLTHILTFGFRGEALASIAAVADVTLRTRREEDETGVEVRFNASAHVSTKETACPKGSSFAVRDLFYNVPARRKFLKSEKVELRHIIDEFTRVALSYPDIAFSLTHNDRDIYVLKPAKSLKFRIMGIFGSAVTDSLADVSAETEVATVSGFAGRPETARKTLGNQFFFVNGRYFRSTYLTKAVLKAYEGFIPDGATPSWFLFLTVDPHRIDVNIHPTKTEIKFEDDSVVFQVLFAAVRESIGRFSEAGDIDFDAAAAEIPVIGRKFSEYRPITAPVTTSDPAYNPFESAPRETKPYSTHVEKHQDYGRLFEEQRLPSAETIVLSGRYIVSRSSSGLMIVNIRRARERLLYDRFLKVFSGGGHYSQTALFPVRVTVGPANVALFEEKAETLASLGFDIAPFGADSVVVNAVPEGFSASPGKVESMIPDLVRVLSDESASLGAAMASAMAERFALLGASLSDAVTSPFEAKALLTDLLSSENPEFTSSGRKIMVIETIDEIEKKF